jgi:hypothetical protein
VPTVGVLVAGVLVLDKLDVLLLHAAAASAVTASSATPTAWRPLCCALLIGSLHCCKIALPSLSDGRPGNGMHKHIILSYRTN